MESVLKHVIYKLDHKHRFKQVSVVSAMHRNLSGFSVFSYNLFLHTVFSRNSMYETVL